jgi:hypothetical protein
MTYNEICIALSGAGIENLRGEAAMLICRFCGINKAELLRINRDEDLKSDELEGAVIKAYFDGLATAEFADEADTVEA